MSARKHRRLKGPPRHVVQAQQQRAEKRWVETNLFRRFGGLSVSPITAPEKAPASTARNERPSRADREERKAVEESEADLARLLRAALEDHWAKLPDDIQHDLLEHVRSARQTLRDMQAHYLQLGSDLIAIRQASKEAYKAVTAKDCGLLGISAPVASRLRAVAQAVHDDPAVREWLPRDHTTAYMLVTLYKGPHADKAREEELFRKDVSRAEVDAFRASNPKRTESPKAKERTKVQLQKALAKAETRLQLCESKLDVIRSEIATIKKRLGHDGQGVFACET